MKKYTHDMPVPLPPEALRQVGSPHLRYVSSWEQTSTSLPRSLHSHPDFAEFTLILAGQGICEVNGILYPITKGDLIICNCGILHDEFIDPKPLSLVSIAADGINLPNLPTNCIISSDTIPLFHLDSSNSEFFNLIKILVDTVKNPSLRCGLICQSLFLALFYLLLDIVDMHHNYHHIATDTTIDLVHQIRLYVDSHITQELSIANIATRFSISPSYLARIFKHAVGCPLSKYIIRRRMGEAQGLLLNSKLPISEIAIRVGYPNQSYFTKLFTQSFDISPLQYRKMSSTRLVNMPNN